MSIETISAWGTCERTSRTWHMRGKLRSSANLVAPVTLARPSTRRNGLPMMRVSRLIPGSASGSGFLIGSAMIVILGLSSNRADFFGQMTAVGLHAADLRFHFARAGPVAYRRINRIAISVEHLVG